MWQHTMKIECNNAGNSHLSSQGEIFVLQAQELNHNLNEDSNLMAVRGYSIRNHFGEVIHELLRQHSGAPPVALQDWDDEEADTTPEMMIAMDYHTPPPDTVLDVQHSYKEDIPLSRQIKVVHEIEETADVEGDGTEIELTMQWVGKQKRPL